MISDFRHEVITQRIVVIPYERFGTIYVSHLQRRKFRPLGWPETTVRNYHYTVRNITEERSSRKSVSFRAEQRHLFVTNGQKIGENGKNWGKFGNIWKNWVKFGKIEKIRKTWKIWKWKWEIGKIGKKLGKFEKSGEIGKTEKIEKIEENGENGETGEIWVNEENW